MVPDSFPATTFVAGGAATALGVGGASYANEQLKSYYNGGQTLDVEAVSRLNQRFGDFWGSAGPSAKGGNCGERKCWTATVGTSLLTAIISSIGGRIRGGHGRRNERADKADSPRESSLRRRDEMA